MEAFGTLAAALMAANVSVNSLLVHIISVFVLLTGSRDARHAVHHGVLLPCLTSCSLHCQHHLQVLCRRGAQV
eukprot:3847514-Rhodomonas_salina.1